MTRDVERGTRHESWRRRMHDYIQVLAHKPFEIGEHDCFTFAVGIHECITGYSVGDEYLDYRNGKEANEILDENGGFVSIGNEIFTRYGFKVNKEGYLSRGDVAVVETFTNDRGYVVRATGKWMAPCIEGGIAPVNNVRFVTGWIV